MSTGLPSVPARWLKAAVVAWTLVGVGILLVAFGWLFGRISTALVPFGLALVIVYLLRGPVAALERRGLKRGPAAGLCYLAGLAVIGVALAFVIPPLVVQVRQFVEAFPTYYENASSTLLDLQGRYESLVVPAWLEDAVLNVQDTLTRQSAEWSALLAKEIFGVGGAAIELLANAVLAMVVGFWLLKDLPVLTRESVMLAGPSRQEEARVVMDKVSRVLGGYLKGQLMLSAATAVIVTVGLTVFGVPYSLVIGLLAGVLNVIPWVGPALTAVIAGIAAAFVNPWLAIAGVGTSLAAQQLTEIFVQPRVMSEQVDLHPLLVIFSLLAGATLFGFVGILLAIPVAAIAKGLFVHYFEKHTKSTLATAEGALFRTRPPDGESAEAAECDRATADGSSAAGDADTIETPEEIE